MSLNASEIPKSVPNGLRYRVACARTNTAVCFAEFDWLASREQAVAFAVKLKVAAGGDYRGITLTLDYLSSLDAGRNDSFRGVDFTGDMAEKGKEAVASPWCRTRSHTILTGNRMPSDQILFALHGEAEILSRLGVEFATVRCSFGDAIITAVNQQYVTLYYFTVED
jgi:hypothetical protein